MALAVMFMLVVVVVNGFSSFRRGQELGAASGNIVSLLNEARAKTLASEGASQYGIHFSSTQAVFFQGTVFSAGNPTNKPYNLPSLIEISAIALNQGGSDVVFQRLTGETNFYGAITLRSKGDDPKTKTVTIRQGGIINGD